jgi:histone-binding protein RBBP4
VEAHQSSVNAISFAMSETILATGSDDATVALWDMRNLSRKLHSLKHHTGDVFTVDWCHDVQRATLLASGGADRRICLWDVGKIDAKQEVPGLTTPAELVFVHGGHSGRVTDITWNPAPGRKLILASVSEDAIVQVCISLPKMFKIF